MSAGPGTEAGAVSLAGRVDPCEVAEVVVEGARVDAGEV